MYVSPRPERGAEPRSARMARWVESEKGRRFTAGVQTAAIAYVALSVGLVAAALLVAHLFPVVAWDDGASEWLAARRAPGWDRVSHAGTFLANTLGVVVVASAVVIIATVRHMGRAALVLIVGLVLEITLFLSVNYAVARPRPDAPHLGSTPSTFSFPSGHVAATVVLYGGIAVIVASRTRATWARALTCLVAILLVTWVGFSRMYSAQHHPTDVVAGLVVGIGALGAAVLAVRPSWVGNDEEEEAHDLGRGDRPRQEDLR